MHRINSCNMLLVENSERNKVVQETSVVEVLCSEVYFKTLCPIDCHSVVL